MLGTVEPTPFDLRFSLFGIPVRVHPLFWLMAALIGWHGKDVNLTLICVVCIFFSILIHELGHALTAQAFGWPPHIVLYSFGGYASFTPAWGHTTGRSVLVLFAGPGAGFLFYAVIRGVEQMLLLNRVEMSFEANAAIHFLEFVNVWWGVFNLLPIYPLDGGQISRAFFTHWRPRDGIDISLKLSLVIAGALAFYLFQQHQTFNALLLGSLAFDNLQALQGGRFR